MTYPIRELAVALFRFFIYLFIYFLFIYFLLLL